jgi:hypothetical protein
VRLWDFADPSNRTLKTHRFMKRTLNITVLHCAILCEIFHPGNPLLGVWSYCCTRCIQFWCSLVISVCFVRSTHYYIYFSNVLGVVCVKFIYIDIPPNHTIMYTIPLPWNLIAMYSYGVVSFQNHLKPKSKNHIYIFVFRYRTYAYKYDNHRNDFKFIIVQNRNQ